MLGGTDMDILGGAAGSFCSSTGCTLPSLTESSEMANGVPARGAATGSTVSLRDAVSPSLALPWWLSLIHI